MDTGRGFVVYYSHSPSKCNELPICERSHRFPFFYFYFSLAHLIFNATKIHTLVHMHTHLPAPPPGPRLQMAGCRSPLAPTTITPSSTPQPDRPGHTVLETASGRPMELERSWSQLLHPGRFPVIGREANPSCLGAFFLGEIKPLLVILSDTHRFIDQYIPPFPPVQRSRYGS